MAPNPYPKDDKAMFLQHDVITGLRLENIAFILIVCFDMIMFGKFPHGFKIVSIINIHIVSNGDQR